MYAYVPSHLEVGMCVIDAGHTYCSPIETLDNVNCVPEVVESYLVTYLVHLICVIFDKGVYIIRTCSRYPPT